MSPARSATSAVPGPREAMRFSATLGVYMGRQMLAGIGVAFLVIAALLFMADLVELGRRVSRDDDADFSIVFPMALLHLPYLAQRAMPYAVLIGALLCLARLKRTNEIAVLGAAGISTPLLLFPGVVVAVLIGTFSVAVFSPLASATLAGYYELDNKYLREGTADLAALRNGLWLRHSDGDGASILHAATIDPSGAALHDVIVMRYEKPDRFVERIDATAARIRDDHWLLSDVLISRPGGAPESLDNWRLDTNLTLNRIQNGFAAPETQSFWRIPDFIAALEGAGFSALRHRLHWHSMAASPVLYAGMVLIAALFALRAGSRGRAGWMIAAGAVCGFGFYIFSDVVTAYGLNGQIPYPLAAWAPAAVAVLLGSALLLHIRQE